ncbi:HEAT repeat-containing protein 5B-like [Artemia franciscana]|uniref:HEAT repeat-containing protein 5A n=1 Tax=Artemia franciscana TaxID=6661 RepID=A0AA88IDD4_ARTSF|nr:hypothetical protein QYM36_000622 [Artemia franciscana]
MMSTLGCLLDEQVFKTIPEDKRCQLVFTWIRSLEDAMSQKKLANISLEKLCDQVYSQLLITPSKAARTCIGNCLAKLLSYSSSVTLLNILNRCNDFLRQESTTLSNNQLAALDCLSCLYSELKTSLGRTNEETLLLICKLLKVQDQTQRLILLNNLKVILESVPFDSSTLTKEIVRIIKIISKDHNPEIRASLFKCCSALCLTSSIMDSELEILYRVAFKNCHDSSSQVSESVGQLLGILSAVTHADFTFTGKAKVLQRSKMNTEQALLPLKTTFLKGQYGFMRGTTDKIMRIVSTKRDVRYSISKAYVNFALTMGSKWLEDNLEVFLKEVLSLLSCFDPSDDESGAVRYNIVLILDCVFGRILQTSFQILALKELIKKVVLLKTTIDKDSQSNADLITMKLSVVCCLEMVAHLLMNNDTLVTHLIDDSTDSVTDLFYNCLSSASPPIRTASAMCLRSVAKSFPVLLPRLVDKIVEYLNSNGRSTDGICGFSQALAAILSCARENPFGISKTRMKVLFNLAEEMIRSNSGSIHLVKSGWLIIGALLSAGMSIVHTEIPRVINLWRNIFNLHTKESEELKKTKIESQPTALTVFNQVGAVSSMFSFVFYCDLPKYPEFSKKFASILEQAITVVVSTDICNVGRKIENQISILKTKLYDVARLLNQKLSKGSPITLLKSLLADIVTSKGYSVRLNSILGSLCDSVSEPLFNESTYECKSLTENWVKHDVPTIYDLDEHQLYLNPYMLSEVNQTARLVDSALKLYGKIPMLVSQKHVSDSITYFQEILNDTRYKADEQSYANIITAILLLTKTCSEGGYQLSYDTAVKSIVSIMLNAICSNNSYLRIASLSCISFLVSSCKDSKIVNDIFESSFPRINERQEFPVGFALMAAFALKSSNLNPGSAQLSSVISSLLKYAQDSNNPLQQKWAMYGIYVMFDAQGSSFVSYIPTSISLCSKLILSSSNISEETLVFSGKLLGAAIMALGPELANKGSSNTILQTVVNICHVLQSQRNPLLQNVALECQQKIYLFNRSALNLPKVVCVLVTALLHPCMELQITSLVFLKQILQRDTAQIYEQGSICLTAMVESNHNVIYRLKNIPCPEDNLGNLLFKMLDTERNASLTSQLRDTMLMLFASSEMFSPCLQLCREVITASQDLSKAEDTNDLTSPDSPDDEEKCKASEEISSVSYASYCTSTKNFAVSCVQTVLKSLSESTESSLSILGDVIRVAFIAALSPMDSLKLEGLLALQILIDKFSGVDDPTYEGHCILEQYQAQIAAALRPSFESDTYPDVSIVACNVLSSWMRGGGASDEYQMHRAYGLLKSGYNRLVCTCTSEQMKCCSHKAFSESAYGRKKLAVLKAWAELYIDFAEKDNPITTTLCKDQEFLSSLWTRVLSDHARVLLPNELRLHVQEIGFHSDDSIFSRSAWTVILEALSLWLNKNQGLLGSLPLSHLTNTSKAIQSLSSLAFEHLCNCKASESALPVLSCVASLKHLSYFCEIEPLFLWENLLSPESLHILHKVVLTKTETEVHSVVIDLLGKLLTSACKSDSKINSISVVSNVGTRISFCVLEICYSLLVRYLPDPIMVMKREIIKEPPFHEWSSGVENIMCGVIKLFELLSCMRNEMLTKDVIPTLLHAVFVVTYQTAFRFMKNKERSEGSHSVTTACVKLIRSLVDFLKSTENEGAVTRTILKILSSSIQIQSKDCTFDPLTRMVLLAIVCKCDVPNDLKPVLARICSYMSSELLKIGVSDKIKLLQVLHSVYQSCSHSNLPIVVKNTSNAIFETISGFSYGCSINTDDVKLYSESLNCLEKLVEVADSDRRTVVLNMLMIALVNCLSTENGLIKAMANTRIQTLASVYPENMKQVLHSSDIRQRIL